MREIPIANVVSLSDGSGGESKSGRNSGGNEMQFSNLDQLQKYVQQIDIGNHATTKRWNAAQNFFHLASAFEGSMDQLPAGYPVLVRLIVRPFRWVVTRYRFPPWLPIPAAVRRKLDPPEAVDFHEQKDRLLSAIKTFQQFQHDHPPHPVLGRLTRDEWIGFHLRHCEHHLAFIKTDGRIDTGG